VFGDVFFDELRRKRHDADHPAHAFRLVLERFTDLRLQPGEVYMIDVRYNGTGATRPDFPDWQQFPFGKRRTVSKPLRAVLD
jgi:hypothetical protein